MMQSDGLNQHYNLTSTQQSWWWGPAHRIWKTHNNERIIFPDKKMNSFVYNFFICAECVTTTRTHTHTHYIHMKSNYFQICEMILAFFRWYRAVAMAFWFSFGLFFCASAKSVVTDECKALRGACWMWLLNVYEKKSRGGVRLASRMPGRNSVIVNNSLEIKWKLLSVL